MSRRHLIDFTQYNFPEYKPNWHHHLIAEYLEAMERGEIKRLMVFMPPRHGKSELCSVQFPPWFLGRNPKKEVMACSYSADLSLDFGRKAKGIVGSHLYTNIFPEAVLSAASRAADRWQLKQGGGYVCTGVGGSITGRGAHCFPKGTMIETLNGKRSIETLQNGERVLSFNHETNTIEWKQVVAIKSRITKQLATITTIKGYSLTGTVDHPVFIFGKGYTEIQNIKEKDAVWIYQRKKIRNSFLCIMWEKIQSFVVRVYKANSSWTQRFLLFFILFKKTPFIQESKKMFKMPKTYSEKNNEILFAGMSFSRVSEITRYSMRAMWKNNSSKVSYYKILFNGLQKFFPFKNNERKEKSELSTRNGNGYVSKNILSNAFKNFKTRQKSMCYMQKKRESLYTSQRQKSKKQRYNEPHNCLHQVPCNSPQIKSNSISTTVYDIQIEDNHNFFANGILVHNCLIIDDPLKGRKEADSQLQRDLVWNWYRGNAYTRLAPRGVIILIMTRFHDDDLAGRILNSQGGTYWHVLDLPALAVKDEIVKGKFIRKKGRALWPTRYDEEALNGIKNTLGPYEWACQYQQNPVDEESIEFKKEWVKYREEEEVDKLMTRRFLTVDTAGKMTAESNHIGLVDNRVDKEGKWNIIARKYKMDPADFVDYLFVIQQKYNYEKIGIEKTIFMDGLEPYIEKVQMEKGITLPIELVKHKGMSKELRIRGLLPYYKNGTIYHVQGHCDELEPQLFRFPKGAEDDIIDALAYQLQIVEAPQGWSDDDFGSTTDAYGDPKKVASDIGDPFNPLGEI